MVDTGTTYSSILLGKCRTNGVVEPQAASKEISIFRLYVIQMYF